MSCSLVHSFLVAEIQFFIYYKRLGTFEFSLRSLFSVDLSTWTDSIPDR